MKHMCVICLSKWFCGIGKPRKGQKKRPTCTGTFLTQCDECLISIPLRYFKDLPL